MRDETKAKINRWVALTLLTTIIVVGAVKVYPVYSQGQEYVTKIADLDAKIASKNKEISFLKDCQRRFVSDRDFVEKIARQNMRVFPGEIVFVFDEE